MLEVKGLSKSFVSGVIRRRTVHAVKDVSFDIKSGKTFGIVGNSGCGKSTIARLLLSLIPPDCGQILIDGEDIVHADRERRFTLTKKIQVIFQHPENSMDPSKRVRSSLLEPMRIHHMYDEEERNARVEELMKLVDLNPALLERYPHQISGGEAQRIMIVRALTLDPSLLILDEPTSMLDVSIQAQVMSIFKELQTKLGLTYLFISHDLDVVRWLCDELAVMNEGALVELGLTEAVLQNPKHEFTKMLIENFSI